MGGDPGKSFFSWELTEEGPYGPTRAGLLYERGNNTNREMIGAIGRAPTGSPQISDPEKRQQRERGLGRVGSGSRNVCISCCLGGPNEGPRRAPYSLCVAEDGEVWGPSLCCTDLRQNPWDLRTGAGGGPLWGRGPPWLPLTLNTRRFHLQVMLGGLILGAP